MRNMIPRTLSRLRTLAPLCVTLVCSLTPQKSSADQVIPDDLIVQGSTCVGFDCVNNESFGFDTIRLKENNTRIKFEDTSASVGFPTTDWQLTANDSASGGANKFSIEDITSARVPFTITGGAPTNSIFVDSTGRVGLRTSTPVLDLHIATSNTPAMRLEQNSGGGFTAQTWDVAGNEANFFIRDVTGGSRLPFRIRPGAPTSSIDISASGDVGIGTASPKADLHVAGATTTTALNQDAFVGIGPDPGSNCAMNVGYGGLSFGAGKGFINVRSCTGGTPDLRLMVATTTKVIVDSAGINVLGTIKSNGTTLTVPDYVFEPDYELMPLQELAAYVEKEKHLPTIPSAQEIKEQGIDLGAMQMRLLKKVEELTLYTIRQDKKVMTLQEQNQKLAAKNAQLQARLSNIEMVVKKLGQR
jgi:hypothetical protein